MVKLKKRGLLSKESYGLLKYPPYKDRKALAKREGNMAVKCTYCDGGQSDGQFGFNGVCSDKMIRYNIESGRVWCSQERCDCCRYYDRKISRNELERLGGPCYESELFREWYASAGAYHNGGRKGETKTIQTAKCGGLCVLTSRTPHDKEADRFIFGLFLIDNIFEGDYEHIGYVESLSKYRLQFSVKQARQLPFWRYYKNPKAKCPEKPLWGTGLLRYLSDAQSVQILQDAVKVKAGTQDEALARDFLAHYCNLNNVNPADVWKPDGALTLNR